MGVDVNASRCCRCGEGCRNGRVDRKVGKGKAWGAEVNVSRGM